MNDKLKRLDVGRTRQSVLTPTFAAEACTNREKGDVMPACIKTMKRKKREEVFDATRVGIQTNCRCSMIAPAD